MKNKLHIIMTSLLLLVCHNLLADGLYPKKAQQRAVEIFGEAVPLKLVTTAQGDVPAYYVFGAERADKGFVIVAGEEDDNEILGYSDSGEFDPQNLPEAVAFWLECYEEQISMIRNGQASPYRATTLYKDVAPFIKTLWGQGSPYNLYNPDCPIDGVKFAATGCVATAMAMMMNYWKCYYGSEAIPAYTYQFNYNDQNVTVNVPSLRATTFRYDLMNDSYDSKDMTESAHEVARLMSYCGRAATMKYYEKESSASLSGKHFYNYFGFNPCYSEDSHTQYTAAEWDSLVYHELEAGRPVLMRGAKHSDAGHAFICDGYKNGLFHINWGWTGSYNGYFKLSEANPRGGGEGAGNGSDGYSFSQKVITHLQPANTDPKEKLMTVAQILTEESSYSRSSQNKDFVLPVTFSVWNRSGDTRHFVCGLGAYQNDVLKNTVTFSETDFKAGTGYNNRKKDISLGAGQNSGKFIIKAICREKNTDEWQEDLGSNVSFLTATISGNTMTVVKAAPQIRINYVQLEGSKKKGLNVTIRTNITNLGVSGASSIYLFVDNALSSGDAIYIDQGKTDDVCLNFLPPEARTYGLRLCGDKDGKIELWSGMLTIAERTDPNLSCNHYTVDNSKNNALYGTTFHLTLSVTNKDSKPFEDELTFKLCKKPNADANYGSIIQTKRLPFTIPANATKDVTVEFDDLLEGGIYFVNTYIYRPSEDKEERLRGTGSYTVLDAASAIATPSVSRDKPDAVVYDLQGRRMDTTGKTLPKGIYVINGKKVMRLSEKAK